MLGTRAAALSRFQTAKPYQVFVIGGGIIGASVAYACARRGWSTLVVDKGDLAGATSSGSTGLLHGGARYAKSMQLRMLGEAISGREAFKAAAPHLVREIEYGVPAIEGGANPYWQMKWGGRAYDLFRDIGWSSFPKSRAVNAQTLRNQGYPFDHPSLRGATFFWDAQTNDHRLALTVLGSAAQRGAAIISHMKCQGFVFEHGKISKAVLADQTNGDNYFMPTSVVVNAAGPWVNELIKADDPETPDHLRVDAGSHLVVRNFLGQTLDHGFFLEFKDRRMVFVLPHDRDLLIGTTSEGERDAKDNLYPLPKFRDYLLKGVSDLFPHAHLTADDIYAGFSAHRPLYTKKPGASENADALSRRHNIRVSKNGLISIFGGKITPALLIGEHTAELVGDLLGLPYERFSLSTPLFGGEITDFSRFLEEESIRIATTRGFSTFTAEHLIRTYGTKADAVLSLADGYPSLLKPLDPNLPHIGAQVAYAVLEEMALSLTDVFSRRLRIERTQGNGLNTANTAAEIMQTLLGWTDDEKSAQIEAYRSHVLRGRGILS